MNEKPRTGFTKEQRLSYYNIACCSNFYTQTHTKNKYHIFCECGKRIMGKITNTPPKEAWWRKKLPEKLWCNNCNKKNPIKVTRKWSPLKKSRNSKQPTSTKQLHAACKRCRKFIKILQMPIMGED